MMYRVGIFNKETGQLTGAVDYNNRGEAEQFVAKFNRTGASQLFPLLAPNTEEARGPFKYTVPPTVEETEELFRNL